MLLIVVPSAEGDGVDYLASARMGLAALHQTVRPPGYPLFIAPLLAIGGLKAVWAAQSALVIALGLFVYRQLGSFWAALLIVTSPFLIAFEWTALAEILTLSLLTVAWVLLSRPGSRRAAMAGVLLGCAALSRDTILLLPIFAIPFGMLLQRERDFTIAAVIASAIVLPWFIHSSTGEGRMGYNLWVGTWERNSEWYRKSVAEANYPANAFTDAAQKRYLLTHPSEAKFKKAALDRITTEPGFVLRNWVARYPRLWQGTRTDHAYLRLKTGSAAWTLFKSVAWGLTLLTLIAGLVALWHAPFWAIPVAYTALIYIPFHNVETRYSLVVFPLLYIAIGLTLPGTGRASFRDIRFGAAKK